MFAVVQNGEVRQIIQPNVAFTIERDVAGAQRELGIGANAVEGAVEIRGNGALNFTVTDFNFSPEQTRAGICLGVAGRATSGWTTNRSTGRRLRLGCAGASEQCCGTCTGSNTGSNANGAAEKVAAAVGSRGIRLVAHWQGLRIIVVG